MCLGKARTRSKHCSSTSYLCLYIQLLFGTGAYDSDQRPGHCERDDSEAV